MQQQLVGVQVALIRYVHQGSCEWCEREEGREREKEGEGEGGEGRGGERLEIHVATRNTSIHLPIYLPIYRE